VQAIETDRLTIRAAVESDRPRFVELFTDVVPPSDGPSPVEVGHGSAIVPRNQSLPIEQSTTHPRRAGFGAHLVAEATF